MAARGRGLTFRSILVPHDFSRHADRALGLAATLAGSRGRLTVLHVVADFPEGLNRMAPQALSRIFARERERLEGIVARAVPRRAGPAATCRLEVGDPSRHIIDAARGMDLIVMSTRGRTGLPHLIIGSVAEKVVRHAPVPVLSFRPEALRARRRGRR